jgi:hypothetical protein
MYGAVQGGLRVGVHRRGVRPLHGCGGQRHVMRRCGGASHCPAPHAPPRTLRIPPTATATPPPPHHTPPFIRHPPRVPRAPRIPSPRTPYLPRVPPILSVPPYPAPHAPPRASGVRTAASPALSGAGP